MIVVAGQQADGNVEMTIQKASQADTTAPAPVLAEMTADQHQIRTFALPLLQGQFEQRRVGAFRTRAASAATRWGSLSCMIRMALGNGLPTTDPAGAILEIMPAHPLAISWF